VFVFVFMGIAEGSGQNRDLFLKNAVKLSTKKKVETPSQKSKSNSYYHIFQKKKNRKKDH